jgi:hypothetical protein
MKGMNNISSINQKWVRESLRYMLLQGRVVAIFIYSTDFIPKSA